MEVGPRPPQTREYLQDRDTVWQAIGKSKPAGKDVPKGYGKNYEHAQRVERCIKNLRDSIRRKHVKFDTLEQDTERFLIAVPKYAKKYNVSEEKLRAVCLERGLVPKTWVGHG